MNLPDEIYMERCIDLALAGAGKVAPNPMVGAVIVYNNKIIGEGWHMQFGGAHAEVNAVNAVKQRELLEHSTLYVNLEPCSHHGKTPPCATLLVSSKIKRVVVGMVDPNPLVAGKGIAMLREEGIEVMAGVHESMCLALNKRFITFIEKKRPYIILKWAQTRNGFIAPDAAAMSREQFEKERHITGRVIQKLVHKWRTEEAAIMVGTNTALTDDPALNAREWEGRNPLRIVLDRSLRLPAELKVFDRSQPTWIINEKKEEASHNLNYVKLDFNGDWLSGLFDRLYTSGIQSMIIEGGEQLLNHVIARGMWDEAIVFYSPAGITVGVKAPMIGGNIIQQTTIDEVQMTQYKRQ